MTIVYRYVKGAPLTIEEIDGNFADLHHRMLQLENSGKEDSLAAIEQEGHTLVMKSFSGAVLGKVDLPKLALNPRGLWSTALSYNVGDIVTQPLGAYYCMISHISVNFLKDHQDGKWEIFLQNLLTTSCSEGFL